MVEESEFWWKRGEKRKKKRKKQRKKERKRVRIRCIVEGRTGSGHTHDIPPTFQYMPNQENTKSREIYIEGERETEVARLRVPISTFKLASSNCMLMEGLTSSSDELKKKKKKEEDMEHEKEEKKNSKKGALGWIEWLRGWMYVIHEMLFQRILASHLQNPMPLPPVNDLTCIVTGSTSGIGREIARFSFLSFPPPA